MPTACAAMPIRPPSSVYPSTAFGSRVHVLVPEDWLPVAKKMVERRRRAKPARVVPLRPRRRLP